MITWWTEVALLVAWLAGCVAALRYTGDIFGTLRWGTVVLLALWLVLEVSANHYGTIAVLGIILACFGVAWLVKVVQTLRATPL